MKIEIIAIIDDELTSGRIVNTTPSFAAIQLFEAGFDIYAIHTIDDKPQAIGEALRRALAHADAVIVTGSLGATDDDLTAELVSSTLGWPTMVNEEILALIHRHLRRGSLSALAGDQKESAGHLEKLACLPSGAETLNPQGGISGYRLVHDGKPIYFLPGIPSRMRHLLVEHVLPDLAIWNNGPPHDRPHGLPSGLPNSQSPMLCQRLFRIFGLTETEIYRRIAALPLPTDARIGYYPVFPDVHLNLALRSRAGTGTGSETGTHGEAVFTRACAMIDDALGDAVYGHDQDNLPVIIGRLLAMQKRTLATAESCTGGMIGQWLTSIAGSSAWYQGGIISYANHVKEEALTVPAAMLAAHGAVSGEVARAMAEGCRRLCRSDLAVAVTGIAGPDGGSPEKPVGTVYIGLAGAEGARAERFLFAGDRQHVREMSAQTALNMVRKELLSS